MSSSSSLRSPLKLISVSADLVVVGGGLAGVCAAITAARLGCKVVLIQDRSVLGGNASSEIKMHIVGADCHGGRPGTRESGLMEELRLEDSYRNPGRIYSQWDLLLYEKVKDEPNITLLLDTTCTGCTVDSTTGAIRSITALRNSTEDEFSITASHFADCSGDSRLGFEAGADYRTGTESRAEYGESLAPEVATADTLGSSILLTGREHATPQPFIPPKWIRKFTKKDLHRRWIGSYEYGYWWFEWGGKLDTIKDNETIRHELLRIALGVWDYIKNSGEHPGSANWSLDWVGSIPGKRESRRLLGTHVLTENDIANGRIFPDAVAYGGWAIDLHPPMGVDAPDEAPCTQTYYPHLYTIPFGCLRSRNVPNLLFAGRNISATHVAFASTRVMATCAVMGQAIGTAAALAVSNGWSLDEFSGGEPLQKLQQQLIKDDAFIPTLGNGDAKDLIQSAAKITASSESGEGRAELVRDGTTRDLIGKFGDWADGKIHHWKSDGLSAWIEVEFPAPTQVREVHLTFDSGFERELILTLSDHMNRKIIRGAQPELVKAYRLLADGKEVVVEPENYLRKRVHALDQAVTVTKLRIEITETHGDPNARLFEIRAY